MNQNLTHLPDDDWLYAGLHELAASGFPKRCATCGAVYADADDYVSRTGRVSSGRSGLKQSIDDDGSIVVELFRNCVCGSTLMDAFADRRDGSEAGLRRRERFSELLTKLESRGLARETARSELIKVMHGQPSSILRVKQRDGGTASGESTS
jgi:hypothetical protein